MMMQDDSDCQFRSDVKTVTRQYSPKSCQFKQTTFAKRLNLWIPGSMFPMISVWFLYVWMRMSITPASWSYSSSRGEDILDTLNSCELPFRPNLMMLDTSNASRSSFYAAFSQRKLELLSNQTFLNYS